MSTHSKDDLLAIFLEHLRLERNLSPHSLRAYAADVRELFEFVAREDIETIVSGNDHFFSIRHFHFEKKPAFSGISEHDIL